MALYGDEEGLAVDLLETRHVLDAFKVMPVKSDRDDERAIAQLRRLGWFRPVHCKSIPAQEVRALLTARKPVQSKLIDIEMSLRGILRASLPRSSMAPRPRILRSPASQHCHPGGARTGKHPAKVLRCSRFGIWSWTQIDRKRYGGRQSGQS